MNHNSKLKIGLALSGGGALGAAHIGMLEQIEKHKINISAVAGTSSGAIIGLLFVSGGTKLINRFFLEINKRQIFSRKNIILSRSTGKIFDQIKQILEDLVSEMDFKDLKTKFLCVATDLDSGEKVILDSGNPINAVLASSDYPGVFPIQIINKRKLVDGGLVENLPSLELKKTGCKYIIGSSLTHLTKLKQKNIQSLSAKPRIIQRAIEIMEMELSNKQIEKCDFCFKPPIENFAWYNFSKINTIRNIGRKYAKNKIKDLTNDLEEKDKKLLKYLGKTTKTILKIVPHKTPKIFSIKKQK